MSTKELTPQVFIEWTESHVKEVRSSGETTLLIEDYGTRRVCKHLITAITAGLDVPAKDIEVNYDEESQGFVLVLVGGDDDDDDDDAEPDNEEVPF